MKNKLLNFNFKIVLGFIWIAFVIVFVFDRLHNNLEIRIIDWIVWFVLSINAAIFLYEGYKLRK